MLRAYIEDRMTEQERHFVELHLLDCELCAEALEGLQLINSEEYHQSIASLEARMVPEQHSRKSNSWIVWASAAAIALLIGSSIIWTTQKIEDASELELAENTKPDKTEKIIEKEEFEPAQDRDEEVAQEAEQVEAIAEIEEPVEPEIILDEDEALEVVQYSVPLIEQDKTAEVYDQPNELTTIEDREQVAAKTTIAASTNTLERKRKKSVSGMVQDQSGEPVPFATVTDELGEANSVTDFEGEFELDFSDDADSLVVRSIGYDEVRQKAEDKPMSITMREQSAVADVVVLGRSERQKNIPTTIAQPRIGEEAYKQYLDTALIYPEEARIAGVEGKVVLSIEVLSSGSLGSITVEKGIGFGCDEEAVRLVRNGPDWKAATKDGASISSTVRQKFKFKLNK
jgi:TonB family protein